MNTPSRPVLVAHRGDAVNRLENTLAAFSAAADLGVRYVELDVQLTADGVPLVLHDANTRRTHGIDVDVRRHDFAALAKLGFFDTHRFPAPIPRLEDFAAWLGERPWMHAFVEIKKESLHTQGRRAVLAAVLEALAPVAGRHMLISYDARVLGMAKQRGQAVGYVLPSLADRYRAVARHMNPALLFADCRQLLRAGSLWPGPWQWATFEVADRGIARRMAALGLDYLETMNPAALAGSAYA